MKHVYTSIDIGSDTIKVVVCQLFNNKLNLLAASQVKSKGIKKGLVIDEKLAGESIKKAINEVEEMLGVTLNKVIVSLPCYDPTYNLTIGKTELNGEIGIVGNDIKSVLDNVIDNTNIDNKEVVINVLPIDFGIDNMAGIKDPKGKIGNVLAARAIVVSTSKKIVYSIVSLLEKIGLEVVDISLSNIGDVNIFKNKEIEENVSAIINIGYELTSVTLYHKGIAIKNSLLDMGSKIIDDDLSYLYKLDSSTAIKLKEKFAVAHKKYASKTEIFELKNKYGEKAKINQYEISDVIMSRLEEILVSARKEINLLTNKEVDYIIITGGTSSMECFSDLCEEVLGNKASIGNIRILGVRNNKYSSALGNVVYFINKLKLKNIDYNMVDEDEFDEINENKNNIMNVINETMLGKVFGYFFND